MTPCFVHIPKTAGSSLRTLLTLNYNPSEIASIYGDFHGVVSHCRSLIGQTAKFKLIQGHIPFGVHFNLGMSAARYCFFLRHPVERHFSDVAHGLRDPTHGFHATLTAEGATAMSWATVADQAIYFRNTSTHYLSGAFFSKELDLPDFHRAAQAVVDSEFVGLAERFDESALIMAKRLGWSHVLYEKRNVASNPLQQLLTPEVRSACETRLPYDMALYHIACERFDAEARAHGEHLQEAAQQLQELVALQSEAMPQLENQLYLVGDPVTTQVALNRTYASDSPLGRWLGR